MGGDWSLYNRRDTGGTTRGGEKKYFMKKTRWRFLPGERKGDWHIIQSAECSNGAIPNEHFFLTKVRTSETAARLSFSDVGRFIRTGQPSEAMYTTGYATASRRIQIHTTCVHALGTSSLAKMDMRDHAHETYTPYNSRVFCILCGEVASEFSGFFRHYRGAARPVSMTDLFSRALLLYSKSLLLQAQLYLQKTAGVHGENVYVR